MCRGRCSGGMMSASVWPIASCALYPSRRCAASFHDVIRPLESTVMIASPAASRARAAREGSTGLEDTSSPSAQNFDESGHEQDLADATFLHRLMRRCGFSKRDASIDRESKRAGTDGVQ